MESIREVVKNIPYEKTNIGNGQEIGLFQVDFPKGCLSLAKLYSGETYGPHKHTIDERVTILSGSGRIIIGDRVREYSPDSIFYIPKGTLHVFKTRETTYIQSIQEGAVVDTESGELDIKSD